MKICNITYTDNEGHKISIDFPYDSTLKYIKDIVFAPILKGMTFKGDMVDKSLNLEEE